MFFFILLTVIKYVEMLQVCGREDILMSGTAHVCEPTELKVIKQSSTPADRNKIEAIILLTECLCCGIVLCDLVKNTTIS